MLSAEPEVVLRVEGGEVAQNDDAANGTEPVQEDGTQVPVPGGWVRCHLYSS